MIGMRHNTSPNGLSRATIQIWNLQHATDFPPVTMPNKGTLSKRLERKHDNPWSTVKSSTNLGELESRGNRACLPVCTICLESVRAMVYIFVHRGHLFWLPESAMKTKNSHSPAASPASQLSLLFLSCILVPFFKGKNRWKMRWWISIMQWADIATIFHVL